ncbi:putative Bacterial cellulose synthase subunit [Vibrio nigripulchritudo SO65]|uniref:cellulose biosynthesis cyclic di-GMP-binding regulatory protein BcsB n=1 Tax=Vibrio nigripulchritudo TaxID=28173 RepID=UPI0003B23DAB|nr:cellulose biosynthesis cyclic di-GMP-binding regulatory protein BcsB [Vibrio nigripulchritudo]CCN36600.1 putative Bacterial cellulose synthase subunit [Vibrio nigripulchritudo AM115]CCN40453.1 putative Bacterial cellulose synthase subunit [Vibrio nigripulchritudo FTn2]CCN67555.1 putative Bacterial cellulose synthase subunit [Vibrio nigripulchritudo POn4]CCN79060.1 putative Bacterial cellulose synthase subunit [Vibrio nigripulchritudo SO65]
MNRLMTLFMLILAPLVYAEKSIKVPLHYATDKTGDLVLRGQSQTITIPISVLDGQKVESVDLALSLYNNNQIDRTLLWIAAGNRKLANVELRQRNRLQTVDIKIPPELISVQNPHIKLRVQHLLDKEPASFDSSALQTTLNLEQSHYTLTYSQDLGASIQTLHSFEEMIQSGQNRHFPIHLVSLIEENSAYSLNVASSLVQGWTLKSGRDDNQFDYAMDSNRITPLTGPTIVFGNKDRLLETGWLGEDIYEKISGPFLSTDVSVKGIEWLMIISGENDGEVRKAAEYFAQSIHHLPKQTHMVVAENALTENRILSSDTEYPLSLFTSQTNLTDSPLDLKIIMPSNILFSGEDKAQINLLLSHTRVDPGQGSMVLRVNGNFTSSLPLRSSYWRDSQHYRLNIPMRDFKPGINKISVEVHGPVGIRDQQSRFTAFMSDKSNLKLGSWVSFIPTESHQVSAADLLALANENGSLAQVTVDDSNPAQLSKLWRLLGYVSHSTQQVSSKLMVTGEAEQKREFHVALNPMDLSSESVSETSNIAEVKQQLFEFVAEDQNSEYASSEVPFVFADEAQAVVKHDKDTGWYRIQFMESTVQQFDSFLRSDAAKPPTGVLSERNFSSNIQQFITAVFIGYPVGLALSALLIIWLMSAVVTRYLEERKCG